MGIGVSDNFVEATLDTRSTPRLAALGTAIDDACKAADRLHALASATNDLHYADLGHRQSETIWRLREEYAQECSAAAAVAAQLLLDNARTYVGASLLSEEPWIHLDPPRAAWSRAAWLHSILISFERNGRLEPAVSKEEAASVELAQAVSRGHRSNPEHTRTLRLLLALLLQLWRDICPSVQVVSDAAQGPEHQQMERL